MKKYTQYIAIAFVMLFNISCNDFLDELPDNRTVIDNKEKIRNLLVFAYPEFNYSLVTELFSDNVVADAKILSENRFYDAIAQWKDVNLANNDSPYFVWQSHYKAIGNANEAISAVEKLGNPKDLMSVKAEALMARAYAHFILVNLFSKPYDPATSNTDLGIPYVYQPETTLKPKYSRGTVEKVYQSIEQDIENALPYLDDNIHEVPKYHFNKGASYAFASKFNLYYQKWDKAEEYASVVLGKNPKGKLRNWKATRDITPNDFETVSMDFVQANNRANLMLRTTKSRAGNIFGKYSYIRYIHNNALTKKESIFGGTNVWGETSSTEKKEIKKNDGSTEYVGGFTYWIKPIEYQGKKSLPIQFYKFQFTDIIAQLGQSRTVNVSFTTDETLLIRAEARIQQKKYTEALDDLNLWTGNYLESGKNDITLDDVNKFYDNLSYATEDYITQKKALSPKFSLEKGTQENLTHYVLQCRRILTLGVGERWFDIRRYGIPVYRYLNIQSRFQYEEGQELKPHDLRKTVQLPIEVIKSGLTPNER